MPEGLGSSERFDTGSWIRTSGATKTRLFLFLAVSTGRERRRQMELTRNQVAERVAPRAMTRRRPNWELRGKREEAREVARFVSPRDKSAKLGDDVWGERKGKLVLQNELGSRRFFFFFTPSFQIKIVNSKGKFTWILRLKRKLEEIEREREKKRGTNFFFFPKNRRFWSTSGRSRIGEEND